MPAAGGSVEAEILRVEGVSKTFNGVRALTDMKLAVNAGEIHALVGHNGSGKSTLVKILSGFHEADPGARAWLHGEAVDISALTRGGTDARSALRFVHQELGLILEMSAKENLELRHGNVTPAGRRSMAADVHDIGNIFESEIDLDIPLANLSPVDRTRVAIYSAVSYWETSGNLLVLDEPTAALPLPDVTRLYGLMQRMTAAGAGILLITHRLEEVVTYADRVSVLRDGELVTTLTRENASVAGLIRLMIGDQRERTALRDRAARTERVPKLSVRDLGGKTLAGLTFEVAEGEVLGFFGLPDSGVGELAGLLTAEKERAATGEARLGSGPWSPMKSLNTNDIKIVPPDRAQDGIIADMTVKENLTLSLLTRLRRLLGIKRDQEESLARQWVTRLQIQPGRLDAPAGRLSGGNQQKVLLGRSLSTSPAVLVLCEPTVGVDIGGRRLIYQLIASEVAQGLSVILISGDIDDLLALCDRVIVLKNGRNAGEQRYPGLDAHELLVAAAGSAEEVSR
jgi:ABC-type sugar transport system ATPase subunit